MGSPPPGATQPAARRTKQNEVNRVPHPFLKGDLIVMRVMRGIANLLTNLGLPSISKISEHSKTFRINPPKLLGFSDVEI